MSVVYPGARRVREGVETADDSARGMRDKCARGRCRVGAGAGGSGTAKIRNSRLGRARAKVAPRASAV